MPLSRLPGKALALLCNKELLVGDFAAVDFDTIDFEGSSGVDALLVSFDLFNVVTARGGER